MKRKDHPDTDSFDQQQPDTKRQRVSADSSDPQQQQQEYPSYDNLHHLQHPQQQQQQQQEYPSYNEHAYDPNAQYLQQQQQMYEYPSFQEAYQYPQANQYQYQSPVDPNSSAQPAQQPPVDDQYARDQPAQQPQQYQNFAQGYQYLAYMQENGKYEPVIIYYDKDGNAKMQPAPELHGSLQQAMQQQQHQQQHCQDDAYGASDSKQSAAVSSEPQEKSSVSELAKRVGLLKNEHKEWRFRDQKRTLLLKLNQSHQQFIENNSLDELLLRRLPHKITPTEFAKRIWLLVFHTIVAEGNPPKFWDRVTDREYLEKQLDDEFRSVRSSDFAHKVYNSIVKNDCEVEEAVNAVQFQNSNSSMMHPTFLQQQMGHPQVSANMTYATNQQPMVSTSQPQTSDGNHQSAQYTHSHQNGGEGL